MSEPAQTPSSEGAPGQWALSPYNRAAEVRAEMDLPERVRITDLTLREGRQVAGVAVALADVLAYAERAAEIGIPVLEMHHYEPEEIRGVKDLGLGIEVQALVHPTAALSPERCREEIDSCLETGADVVSLALAISDHNEGLARSMAGVEMSIDQMVENTCEAIGHGRARGANTGTILMDFTRLDADRLASICARLAAAGAQHIRLDDICAPAIPAAYRYLTRQVKQAVGDTPIAIHTHNDFDLALASQLAAVEGGAEIVEASMNGLGERAGVPNLAAMASVLELMYGFDTGVSLDGLQGLAEFVAEAWNQPISPHLAVVGRTAFSHATEVHYVHDEGVDEWAWNSWSPDVVGNRAYVPLCIYSGPYAIRAKAHGLGLPEPGPEQSEAILAEVRAELRRRRSEIDDEWFKRTVERVATGGEGDSG